MRYIIFMVFMICRITIAEEIQPLLQGDAWRKGIAEDLRNEEGLQEGLFNLRRIEANSSIAYVCGLIKDKDDNFQQDVKGGYHLYDRVMVSSYQGTWISAARFDSEIDSPQDVHCFYGKEVKLGSALLWKKVAEEGRKQLCQPVKNSDPLRENILDGLRSSYIGDSNSVKLNSPLPKVKFVVDDICATENYAHFTGDAVGDAVSIYKHDGDDDTELDVVLRKSVDGIWHPMPESRLITQQLKSTTKGYYYYGMLQEMDLKKLAQACLVEGDTLNFTGMLRHQGNGTDAYWVVEPENPPSCVRDASSNLPEWNTQIQLMLSPQEQVALSHLLDKKVTVSGDIFLALSMAHHTPLVLDDIFRVKLADN